MGAEASRGAGERGCRLGPQADARGRLDWAPGLGWQLDAALAGFDPGYFLPGWDGAVDGRVQSRGAMRVDGGIDASFVVAGLGGQLRGRALAGGGTVAFEGPPRGGGTAAYSGDIALTVGESRIEASGRIADSVDVAARLAPMQLSDLMPDAAGTVRGTLRIRGPRAAPGITADLAGTGIDAFGFVAESATLQGTLPASGSGALALIWTRRIGRPPSAVTTLRSGVSSTPAAPNVRYPGPTNAAEIAAALDGAGYDQIAIVDLAQPEGLKVVKVFVCGLGSLVRRRRPVPR